MTTRYFFLTLFIIATGCLTNPSRAYADARLEQAREVIEETVSNAEKLARSRASGRQRTTFCRYCHGPDGNSVKDGVPNLAGQNPVYLYVQFDKFASGERTDYVMSELAESLSEQERIDLALYYFGQEVRPVPSGNPELAARGESVYRNLCRGCHGDDGLGKKEMPRLAGQSGTYLVQALSEFRNKAPNRAVSPMQQVAGQLDDADIEAIAAYLSRLEPSG